MPAHNLLPVPRRFADSAVRLPLRTDSGQRPAAILGDNKTRFDNRSQVRLAGAEGLVSALMIPLARLGYDVGQDNGCQKGGVFRESCTGDNCHVSG